MTPDGEFITLFVVPFKNGSKHEVMNDLVLVKLARMVSMIWLGAAGLLADLEHRKRADGPDTAIFVLIIDPDINFERALSW